MPNQIPDRRNKAFGLLGLLCLAAGLLGQARGQTVISAGSTWKYRDDGSNQGTLWRAVNFNDSAWSSGPAQLGYGDGDENTVVSFGPSSSSKFVTTYFRRAFVVQDATLLDSALVLGVLRDDGAVVYLNGREVFRSNMPGGTIAYRVNRAAARYPLLLFRGNIDRGVGQRIGSLPGDLSRRGSQSSLADLGAGRFRHGQLERTQCA